MLNKRELMKESQEKLRLQQASNLTEFLENSQNPLNMLGALLFACGFPYVDCDLSPQQIRLLAGYSPSNLEEKIVYKTQDRSIYGRLEETIKKVFLIVNSLVNEMDIVALLPPEMRRNRINNLIRTVDVDESFFEMVLKNWL